MREPTQDPRGSAVRLCRCGLSCRGGCPNVQIVKKRPIRCRLGWHKKRLRPGHWAERTFLLVGVNLYECARCDWHMRGIGEPDDA